MVRTINAKFTAESNGKGRPVSLIVLESDNFNCPTRECRKEPLISTSKVVEIPAGEHGRSGECITCDKHYLVREPVDPNRKGAGIAIIEDGAPMPFGRTNYTGPNH